MQKWDAYVCHPQMQTYSCSMCAVILPWHDIRECAPMVPDYFWELWSCTFARRRTRQTDRQSDKPLTFPTKSDWARSSKQHKMDICVWQNYLMWGSVLDLCYCFAIWANLFFILCVTNTITAVFSNGSEGENVDLNMNSFAFWVSVMISPQGPWQMLSGRLVFVMNCPWRNVSMLWGRFLHSHDVFASKFIIVSNAAAECFHMSKHETQGWKRGGVSLRLLELVSHKTLDIELLNTLPSGHTHKQTQLPDLPSKESPE